MPIWLYQVHPLITAMSLIVFIETLSLVGLLLTRRIVLPRLNYNERINEAVSGTVQAIGVFYGITVGLIAVGVWNTNSLSSDLVSKEAASIGALYRDTASYPSPLREELRKDLREYTVLIINEAWPGQKMGVMVTRGTAIIDDFQARLFAYQPADEGQKALHTEALQAYNTVIENRHLRIDAVNNGLSGTMWAVIWIGAVISIGVAYFFLAKAGLTLASIHPSATPIWPPTGLALAAIPDVVLQFVLIGIFRPPDERLQTLLKHAAPERRRRETGERAGGGGSGA